jgi:hypothetical protein
MALLLLLLLPRASDVRDRPLVTAPVGFYSHPLVCRTDSTVASKTSPSHGFWRNASVGAAVRGEHDDRECVAVAAEPPLEMQSVHAWHVQIEDEALGRRRSVQA